MKKKYATHLRDAPIVEAILDIRVTLSSDIHVSHLKGAHDLFKAEYPISEEGHAVEAKLKIPSSQDENGQTITDQVIGYRFRTTSGEKIVQFRLDGFSFNHLKPYPEWKEFIEEAWKYWLIYLSVAKPNNIVRLALRYINRANFPRRELKEYIEHPPEFGEEVPGELAAFVIQSQLRLTDNVTAAVVQMMEPEGAKPGMSYVLDIDVSRAGNIRPSDDSLLKYFLELHNFKNDIFFGTLKHKAIDIWKPETK